MICTRRAMLQSVLLFVLFSICGSGCLKMNVIAQDGEKKGGQSPSTKGFSGFKKETELKIDVHTAAILPPVSPVEATTIFNRASEIVQRSDGPGDVECPVKFTLNNGVVGTFDDAPQIINDYYDLQELNNKYNGVKVVLAILYCNQPEFWPGISGCAQRGQGVVVVREDPSLEPVLAAHEANHAFGGVHRNESNAVMNEILEPQNKYLNASECVLYR